MKAMTIAAITEAPVADDNWLLCPVLGPAPSLFPTHVFEVGSAAF